MLQLGVYLPVYGGWLQGCEEQENPPEYPYVREAALKAERIGLDFLWIPDHLLNPIKGEAAPSLEAWTVAAALAQATTRIRLAHTCICEGFRHPAVLAKQVACLHEVSGGRYLFCIGAGWQRREYQSYGLRFYSHDKRVERAREAISIVSKLLKEDGVSLKGKYYSIQNGVLQPKIPGAFPVWYAGMSTASRELVADVAGGWLMGESRPEELASAIADMKERLARRNRTTIDMAVPADTIARETDKEARAALKSLCRDNPKALRRLKTTGLIGSYRTIAERIREIEKLGVGQVIFKLSPTIRELDHIEKLLKVLAGA